MVMVGYLGATHRRACRGLDTRIGLEDTLSEPNGMSRRCNEAPFAPHAIWRWYSALSLTEIFVVKKASGKDVLKPLVSSGFRCCPRAVFLRKAIINTPVSHSGPSPDLSSLYHRAEATCFFLLRPRPLLAAKVMTKHLAVTCRPAQPERVSHPRPKISAPGGIAIVHRAGLLADLPGARQHGHQFLTVTLRAPSSVNLAYYMTGHENLYFRC